MNIKISPSQIHNEKIILPSSKSEIHRVLIIMAFSCLKGEIHNCTVNDDVLSTINFLEGIGSKIVINGSTINIDNTNLLNKVIKDYHVNESGTTLRLMIPFLSKLNREINIYTKGNLINRPLDIFESLMNLKKENLIIDKTLNKITIKRHKFDEDFIIYGNISSQFISGLLLYQSLMLKRGSLVVIKPLVSKPYVDLTIECLKQFGYNIDVKEESNIITYTTVCTPIKKDYLEYSVESDYSSAAFLIALSVLNNDLSLSNLKESSLQADKKIVSILKEMNGKINFSEGILNIKKSTLKSTEIDLLSCPDLGPILFVIAATINCKTIFTHTNRLQDKESNRLISMKENLEKLGVTFNIFDDKVEIIGFKEKPNGNVFDSFNDHRIAMSLAILSTILKTPSTILNTECVNKSYPNFYNDLEKLGVKISL